MGVEIRSPFFWSVPVFSRCMLWFSNLPLRVPFKPAISSGSIVVCHFRVPPVFFRPPPGEPSGEAGKTALPPFGAAPKTGRDETQETRPRDPETRPEERFEVLEATKYSFDCGSGRWEQHRRLGRSMDPWREFSVGISCQGLTGTGPS